MLALQHRVQLQQLAPTYSVPTEITTKVHADFESIRDNMHLDETHAWPQAKYDMLLGTLVAFLVYSQLAPSPHVRARIIVTLLIFCPFVPRLHDHGC